MALYPPNRNLAGQAAAPADLDHVAQRFRVGRLADQAHVEPFVVSVEPFQHFLGAVDGVAFLVARNEQADRAAEVCAAVVQEARDGGHEGGNRPLHVGCAAAVQDAVAHLSGEGIVGPVGRIAFRHDIGMAGETEIRAAGSQPGVQVVDPMCAVAKGKTAAGEAEALQCRLQDIQSAFVFRRDGRPADQVPRQGKGFDHVLPPA